MLSMAESSEIPYAKEKVITCYGIVGLLSLATSQRSNVARC